MSKKKSKKEKKNKKDLKKIKKHRRINDILLGAPERAAISWLVKRMPLWVNSDMLTFLGLFAAILIGVSYYLSSRDLRFLWLASFGFVLNWFGDSLDGNLARYRKVERPRYGFFIDHVIDTVSEVIIFSSLGMTPFIDQNLAIAALIGYQCMSNLVYITTSVKGEFKISYGSLGPTEIRVIAILVNTFMFFYKDRAFTLPFKLPFYSQTMNIYNLAIYIIVILLTFFFIYTATKTAIKLERKDRKKWLKKMEKFESSAED